MAAENPIVFAEIGNPKRVTQLTENTSTANAYFLTEKAGEPEAKKTAYGTVENSVKAKVQSEYSKTLSPTPSETRTMSEKLEVAEFKKRDDAIKTKASQDDLNKANEDIASIEKLTIKTGESVNIFNPNYQDGVGKVINSAGEVVSSSLFYTNEGVLWGNNTNAIISKTRSWAQYDANGAVVSNWYAPTPEGGTNVAIKKHTNAVSLRMSTQLIWTNVMANFGIVLQPYQAAYKEITTDFYGNQLYAKVYIDVISEIQAMILTENYTPVNPVYVDGVISNPVNVKWGDGATGYMNIFRNADSVTTSIEGRHTKNSVTTNFRMTITRDVNNNVISVSTIKL